MPEQEMKEQEMKEQMKPLVKQAVKDMGVDLNKNGIDDLVDDLVKNAEKIKSTSGVTKAINAFVNGYNKLRRKPKATNQAMANEKHQPLKMPHGGLEVAMFSGPSTEIIRRIKESLRRWGKVKGFTPVDTVAAKHDVQYALADDVGDIRRADNEMKRRIASIMKRGLDSKYNATGGIAIAAKTALEDLKLLSKDKFAAFKALNPKEKQLLEKVLDQLEGDQVKQGWGQEGGKKKRKPTAWNKHVMKVKKQNPSLSFKEVLIKAKGSYKN